MPDNKQKKVQAESITTTIRVTKDLWKRFRIETIERDIGQQEGLEEALRAWLGEAISGEAGPPAAVEPPRRKRSTG